MKKIYLSEVSLSDLLEEVKTVVQQIVQSEIKSMISANANNKSPKAMYLTSREVCAKFRISAASVHRHVNSGVFERFKIGRKSLYREQQIEESLIKLNTMKRGY